MDARTETTESSERGPRRGGLAHAIALVRTTVYSVTATLYFLLTTTICVWVMLFPPQKMRHFLIWWARGDLFLLRLICGQSYEVRGEANRPQGPALVASKHQAAWETLALLPILPRGAFILKKELLKIPIYGAYARFFGMIPVDRTGGAAALKQLDTDAKDAIAKGFQIIIFPEGTRQLVGAPPDYKPGAIFLYDRLNVPLVPVALNSGLYWPRRRFVRYPGKIIVSFLPAIPPGLKRTEATERLKVAIEEETAKIVAEARQAAR
ncbi:MAG: lysophospholipid acyltransferase family protein [Pseudomonadota bacterium]